MLKNDDFTKEILREKNKSSDLPVDATIEKIQNKTKAIYSPSVNT